MENENKSIALFYSSSFLVIKSAQELWTITPQKLILDMNETSSSTYKLKLINYSKIDLPFVIDQSDNVFVVTPSVDKVSALGEIGIRVDVKPTFVAKMRENVAGWDGYLSVQCNGDKKVSSSSPLCA